MSDYPARHAAEPDTEVLPAWEQPVPERVNDALAKWSLALSVLWAFGIASVLAIVFALASNADARRHARPPSALATGGLWLGCIGAAITLTAIIASAL